MIEIKEVRPMEGMGNLRAFVTVRFDGNILIRDFRIIQQPEQRAWVSPPQVAFERDGKRRWYPVITFPPKLKAEIDRVILASWALHERGPP